MRYIRMLALGASLLVLAGACGTGGGSPSPESSPAASLTALTVRIGSAGFYESALMAEIYAQVLEANGFSVDRQLNIGPRNVTFPAIESDQLDLMPEYIGSTLEFVVLADGDEGGEASADSEQTASRLRERLSGRGLTILGYTPAQDKNAFVVRADTAEQYVLSRISDLTPIQDELTWGLPPECETNPLCGGALSEAYGIDLQAIDIVELGACGGEIATALDGGTVDVGELCSTQPDIERFGFVVLEDDQGTQPAENLAPLVRTEWLERVGGAEAVAGMLDPVSQAMTTEELTSLNVRVGVEQEDVDVVAREWLQSEGLLP